MILLDLFLSQLPSGVLVLAGSSKGGQSDGKNVPVPRLVGATNIRVMSSVGPSGLPY